MKKLNWGNVEAASEGYAAPPAGGYVLAICAVEDHADKQYLKIYCDIAGVADKANEQFVGYYGQRKERSGDKIPLFSFIRSYKDSALGFFKAFLVALEKSGNAGFWQTALTVMSNSSVAWSLVPYWGRRSMSGTTSSVCV